VEGEKICKVQFGGNAGKAQGKHGQGIKGGEKGTSQRKGCKTKLEKPKPPPNFLLVGGNLVVEPGVSGKSGDVGQSKKKRLRRDTTCPRDLTEEKRFNDGKPGQHNN